MFAFMKGRLVEASPLFVIVEVSSIGYKIFTPIHLLTKLPSLNEEVLLYTSFVVRENSQTLYGFLLSQERDLFETLQGVSGIGPKLALGIIGNITPKDLHLAITHHDLKAVSKIPGVGKKTAERLMIEMRDKLNFLFPDHEFKDYAIHLPMDGKLQIVNDAMSALVQLGYNQMTAQKAIKKTLKDLDEEELDLGKLITSALQNIIPK